MKNGWKNIVLGIIEYIWNRDGIVLWVRMRCFLRGRFLSVMV